MIPLFLTKQVREVDSYAISKIGMPGIVLMENAALSIYDIVMQNYRGINIFKRIGFICGKGNNGGDGFAVARHFANNGFEVTVVYLGSGSDMSEDCSANFTILNRLSKENKKIKLKRFSAAGDLNLLKNCDVIFDAMLGSGMEGDIREPYKSIVKKINIINAYKVAVDIPTGLDSDKGSAETVFKSDLTVTLGEFKAGLFFGDGYSVAGKVIKGDIGINSSFFDKYSVDRFLIEPEDALDFFPHKIKSEHKYSAGKVLTISGSAKLPGAAALSSSASLSIGAGASILAFPDSAKNLVHSKLSEVIVETYNDSGKGFLSEQNVNELQERLEWADVVAIGSGLGREKDTGNSVLKIIKERKFNRMVIDADAIFALSQVDYKKLNLKDLVFTPHHGEFANLLGIKVTELKKDLLKYGSKFVQSTGAYLILKGAPTIIFTPGQQGEIFINTTGNPGMAKFGTGDVLTGVLAGIIAQSKEIEKSIIAGVYIHSLSADLLVREYTEFGYTAETILKNLPSAIKFLRDSIV
jgi:ADP-dependent NAD(P)H-hydrate dehydratase / NAD(P)H-hydrate epimerase